MSQTMIRRMIFTAWNITQMSTRRWLRKQSMFSLSHSVVLDIASRSLWMAALSVRGYFTSKLTLRFRVRSKFEECDFSPVADIASKTEPKWVLQCDNNSVPKLQPTLTAYQVKMLSSPLLRYTLSNSIRPFSRVVVVQPFLFLRWNLAWRNIGAQRINERSGKE